jgi:DNA-binding MarR family transcriptional regulator
MIIINGEESLKGALVSEEKVTRPSGESPLDLILHYVLDRACETITAQVNAALNRISLSTPHYYLLFLLGHFDQTSQQEMAVMLNVNQNAMVHLLDDLEELSLATRKRDPENRRRHVLSITDKGKKTLNKANVLVEQVYVRCYPDIAPAKRREIIEALAHPKCPRDTSN